MIKDEIVLAFLSPYNVNTNIYYYYFGNEHVWEVVRRVLREYEEL